MKCLVVYFNNITKYVYNELAYGTSIENVIYNFKHYPNISNDDKIINIIKIE